MRDGKHAINCQDEYWRGFIFGCIVTGCILIGGYTIFHDDNKEFYEETLYKHNNTLDRYDSYLGEKKTKAEIEAEAKLVCYRNGYKRYVAGMCFGGTESDEWGVDWGYLKEKSKDIDESTNK